MNGYEVTETGPSKDPRFSIVVLCEWQKLVVAPYAVWYEDEAGQPHLSYFTTSREDARAEFQRRIRGDSTC